MQSTRSPFTADFLYLSLMICWIDWEAHVCFRRLTSKVDTINIHIRPRDEWKVSFITPDGLYEWMIKLFFQKIKRLYGMPSSIISNWDSKFLATLWTTSWQRSDTSLKYSSTAHLQIVGQTKVVNCTLGNLLRSISRDKPRAWGQALRQEKFAYNSMVQGSIRFSRTQKK